MTKQETEIQKQIMLALSEYGIVIRQQSGNFYTEYGGRIKVGFTGLSDLQFISNDGSLVCFIEVKRPVKRFCYFRRTKKIYKFYK